MTSYVIDLEAVAFEPVYSAWKANNPDKDFVPAFACQIASLGYAKLGNDFRIEKLGVACVGNTEREGLELFSAAVAANKAAIVTWNGRGFDMPLVSYRCLHYGVPLTWYHEEKSDYRNRYKTDKHFDLMDYISDYGQTKPSLDYMAKLLGLPGKMDTKGSDVEQLFKDGKFDEIIAYNTTDVLQQLVILYRVLLTRGTVTRDQYLGLINWMVNCVKAEGSLDLGVDSTKTVLGNSIENPNTLAIAKGCRTLLKNWDVQASCAV